jgi:DNA-binding transcriptional regulator LsrR (DeoR family)
VYSAILEQHVSNADLADRLGMSERAVRRLLDLDHRSELDQIEPALAARGKRLEITVRDAA